VSKGAKEFDEPPTTSTTSKDCTPAGGIPAIPCSELSSSGCGKATDRTKPFTREPWRIVDIVVDGMREQPGTAFAARALAMHVELKEGLRERGQLLADAARKSRHPPIDFYTALVQSAVRIGRPALINTIVDDMVQQGVARTLGFYESTMKQLAGQKHYHLALSMSDRLVADGLEPTAVTCSCLINFAAEVGELKRAVAFFEKLKSITTPSIRAYMTVLRVHAKRQDWPASLDILHDMERRGSNMDSLALNVALGTGIAADQVESVEELIKEITAWKKGFLDVVSHNTLLKGYAQRGDVAGIRSCIQRLRAQGLAPNAITFNTAMDGAVRGLDSNAAWCFMKDMRESGLKPDKFTCSILVKSINKNSKKEQVAGVLALLHEVAPMCDSTLCTNMYHVVLEITAQMEDTSLLLQVFSAMRRHQVVPNTTAYKLLSNALKQKENADQCSEVLQQILMEDSGPELHRLRKLVETHGLGFASTSM